MSRSKSLESLPMPTGLYCIGLAKYDLEDIYRKEIQFPQGRLIPIQVYFPMQKGVHKLHSKIFEERAAIGPFQPLQSKVYSRLANISLLEGYGHPVILLNHASTVPLDFGHFFCDNERAQASSLECGASAPPFKKCRKR